MNSYDPLYLLCSNFTYNKFDKLKNYIYCDVVKLTDDNNLSLFQILCYQKNISIDVLEFMITHGSDINNISILNDNPFHFICKYNPSVEKIKFMLIHGANIHQNDNGETPLHYLNNKMSCAYLIVQHDFGLSLPLLYFNDDIYNMLKKNKIDKIMCMLIMLRYTLCGPIILDEILNVTYNLF
jgi:hypothetical protein